MASSDDRVGGRWSNAIERPWTSALWAEPWCTPSLLDKTGGLRKAGRIGEWKSRQLQAGRLHRRLMVRAETWQTRRVASAG